MDDIQLSEDERARLDWLREHRCQPCPDHGGQIKASTLRGVYWCASCQQEWRAVRPYGLAKWWRRTRQGTPQL